jgi:hypothetical protein
VGGRPAPPLDLGDAEVEDLREHGVVVAIDEEHVVGLEVPVDDPRLVGAGEAAQQLGRDVQRFGELEAAEALDAVAEVFAAQELHHDERQPRLGLSGVEDRDDVGALDGARGLRFALEALIASGVALSRSMNLRANFLPRVVWMPSYTRPMPPTPIRRVSLYLSIVRPTRS